MKICVLGSEGYIGSALVPYLESQGHSVCGDDRMTYGRYNSQAIKRDYRYMSTGYYHQFDAIILLAGHSSVASCKREPIEAYYNNVTNFVHLTNVLRPTQKFIYASSSSVYGITNDPAEETDLLPRPTSVYDLHKQTIDMYAHLSGLNYYGLRFGTVNGAAPNLRNELMINKMVEDAMLNKEINVVNGFVSRPILFINDLCRAVELIVSSDKREPGTYNLASFNSTVEEIGAKVARTFNCKYVSKVDLNSYVYDMMINCDKIKNVFGFEPTGTVENIVASMLFDHGTIKNRQGRN